MNLELEVAIFLFLLPSPFHAGGPPSCWVSTPQQRHAKPHLLILALAAQRQEAEPCCPAIELALACLLYLDDTCFPLSS